MNIILKEVPTIKKILVKYRLYNQNILFNILSDYNDHLNQNKLHAK
jgi:hypothetical protein